MSALEFLVWFVRRHAARRGWRTVSALLLGGAVLAIYGIVKSLQ
jgi:hypothetical protein